MKYLTGITVFLLIFSIFILSARADQYFDYESYGDSGLVTACGMSLLLIDGKAGKLTPFERARVVSERLNYLLYSGNLSPASFKVGSHNGQVILEHIDTIGQRNLIVTVDSNVAKKFRGANGSRTLLGYWWLSLLRDNLLIAQGQKPIYSIPYGTGYVLEKVYMKAIKDDRYTGGPISVEILEDAINDLAKNEPNFTKDFEHLYSCVPQDFTLAEASKIEHSPKINDLSYNSTSIPGPDFDENRYYGTNDITIHETYKTPSPKPTSQSGTVSYQPTKKPTPKPTAKPTPPPASYPSYNEPSYYYQPVPVPQFPSDAPQTLPPDFIKNLTLMLTPEGTLDTSLKPTKGNMGDNISEIEYFLMDNNKKELTRQKTDKYPFNCELQNNNDAKYIQLNIKFKNGKKESILYQLF